MEARALWNLHKTTATVTTASPSHCTPFTLPANGVMTLSPDSVITLASDVVFEPQCTSTVDVTIATTTTPDSLRDPFYSSTLPGVYALAAATVVSYMLVIILFITPRSFLSGGTVVLGRRSFTNGPASGEAGIGIGGRPWLQKVAALTVSISLTIATANTFNIAEYQYEIGFSDANSLQTQVLNGQELKIIQVISDTFLWLAQAQTLIRLFPRQREKVIIKWTALALIILDLLFNILNNFVYEGNSRPRAFIDAIPALSYLFQLALGLLYAAWVMYYAITKKQYAFYHPKMRNICLLALIALLAVLVPVVFFVLDISKPDVAGWGDYVRWVGAAAASVVVWEWVERIEALERNDKKDGVLGREVFDGDEMLEVTPSANVGWSRRLRRGGHGDENGGASTGAGSAWPATGGITGGITSRYRPRSHQTQKKPDSTVGEGLNSRISQPSTSLQLPKWPIRPPPTATPVSRTDTASAESTVYAIRYHPISENSGSGLENSLSSQRIGSSFDIEAQHDDDAGSIDYGKNAIAENTPQVKSHVSREPKLWQAFSAINPFGGRRHDPPPEVSAYTAETKDEPTQDATTPASRRFLGKLEDFASSQAERFLDRKKITTVSAPLPVTRIPAPPRRRTLQEISEQLEHDGEIQTSVPMTHATDGSGPASLHRNDSQQLSLVSRQPSIVEPANNTDVINRRRRLSFAEASHSDWEHREHPALISNPVDASVDRSPQPSRTNSSNQDRSPPPRSTSSSGLPVLRIPPPHRSRRSEE